MSSAANTRSVAANPQRAALSSLNERERQIDDDYEWCLSDAAIRQRYAGQVIVVNQRHVFGAGKNHRDAWVEATRASGCPAKQNVAFVAIPE